MKERTTFELISLAIPERIRYLQTALLAIQLIQVYVVF